MKPRIVAEHSYQDADGNERYQVCRYEPKDFRQRRKVNGSWQWNMKGVELLPYRLPEVIDTVKRGELVVIVEGEKDADNVLSRNICATTFAGGAGKWKPHYAEYFKGATVAIIADKDEPGRKHARQVATALSGVAASVKLLEVPQGKDVSDYFATGASANDLLARIQSAPLFTPQSSPSQDGHVSVASYEWPDPQPIPPERPEAPPFDYELLPRNAAPWTRDIAERMQCPPEFVAVPLIIALGSVIGRRLSIRPKRYDDWTVIPTNWAMLIGPPSVLKSPAMEEALRPLRRLEVAAREQHKSAVTDYEAKQLTRAAQRKLDKDAIEDLLRKKNKDKADILARSIVDAEADAAPTERRYSTADATIEMIGVLLNQNPRGLLLVRDEIVGWLRSLDREDRSNDRAFYLQSWNGTTGYCYDRIGRGTLNISACCISVVGGIQPGPIREYIAQAIRGNAGSDGLLQRFSLTVWPEDAAEWRDVDRYPDKSAKDKAFAMFENLDQLDPRTIGATQDEYSSIPTLHFDDEAQAHFNQWRADFENSLRVSGDHEALKAHFTKYRKAIPALALILHLADRWTGPINDRTLSKALLWHPYLEGHARKLYGGIVRRDTTAAIEVAEHLRNGDLPNDFALKDVYRPGWSGLSDSDSAAAGVDLLVKLGWLREELKPTNGRPRMTYLINPRVLK